MRRHKPEFVFTDSSEVFMKIITTTLLRRWMRSLESMLVVALMVPAVALSLTLFSNPSPVPLLTAGTYGALSYGGMTGTANVNGDVGSSNSNVGAGINPIGGVKWPDGGSHNLAAQTDLGLALTEALNNRPSDATISADALGGLVLHRGVYSGGALDLAGGATLELNGSASDVFIIKAASSLTINIGSTISLTGGAVWSNVFWYVGSSATIFSGSTFSGILLAVQSITLNGGAAQVTGRLLANTGAVGISSTVLPVEITAFTATANRMNTELHWSTSTEVNNNGFAIERRQAATWDKVGFVSGAGTSNSPRDYSYTDNNLSPGRYTYRLKQVDNNGAFSYHSTIEVEIGSAPQAFELSQNYPNPFNPSTVISYQLPVNSKVTLKVYDVLGNEVTTLVNGEMAAGSYTVPFSAISGSTLASGMYIYRLEAHQNDGGQAGSFVSTKKLVLMK